MSRIIEKKIRIEELEKLLREIDDLDKEYEEKWDPWRERVKKTWEERMAFQKTKQHEYLSKLWVASCEVRDMIKREKQELLDLVLEVYGEEVKTKIIIPKPNHGDEQGKKEWSICYGEPDGDEIIVGAEDRKKEAVEMCKRLNKILHEKKELIKEAQKLVIRLLPRETYGENSDAERLYDILQILEGTLPE